MFPYDRLLNVYGRDFVIFLKDVVPSVIRLKFSQTVVCPGYLNLIYVFFRSLAIARMRRVRLLCCWGAGEGGQEGLGEGRQGRHRWGSRW